MRMGTIILDTTLREGQLYRMFSRGVNVRLATMLAEAGVGRIELTVDYPPRTTYEDVACIVDALRSYPVEIVMHGRAFIRDVDAISKYDVHGCALYLAPTDIHRRYKLGGISYEEAVQRFKEAIGRARELGMKYIRATVEDASRLYFEGRDGMEKLMALVEEMGGCGATIVSVPDTSGMMSPRDAREFVRVLKSRCKTQIACHFHNDYGYASADTVEAAAEGADEVHVCVMGIGDRNGIADLYEVVAALEDLYGIRTGVRRDALSEIYERFWKLTGIRPCMRHPLSKEARTVRAGVHQSMVVYQPVGYVPEKKLLYDFKSGIMLEATPYMSHKVLKELLSKYGLDDEAARRLTEELARLANKKGGRLLPSEVAEILREKGFEVSGEDVYRFLGYEYAYILIKLKPQSPTPEIIGELLSWDEVEDVDEVYGDVDMVVRAKILPGSGNVVSKLKKVFASYIDEVKVLITD